MAFFEGKNASVTISAVSQPFDKFDLKFKAEIIDTTNFTSAGYQSNQAGIFSADATVDGPYNGSLGLTQGQSITKTFATGGGGPSFAIPFRNSEIGVNTAARNAVARSPISMTSNGTFSVSF